MLNYQTDLKVANSSALRNEVDDIWSSFRKDAENAKVGTAIIRANELPEGAILKKSRGYEFVYKRDDDGSWRCLDDSRSKTQ